ncbi:MAG: YtxH domain-containing protein [Chloroflexota bacterium]
MADRSSGGAEFFAGLVIGGLVGAALALLLAPQSGEETRAQIRDKSLEYKDRAEEGVLVAREKAQKQIASLQDQVSSLQQQVASLQEKSRAQMTTLQEKGKEALEKGMQSATEAISKGKETVSQVVSRGKDAESEA